MAKTKTINKLSKEQKYERQKLLNSERVRRFREKMTEEKLEEKRRKDRERYHKKKEQNLVKSVNELSEREKRRKRKAWRVNSKNYRKRKNHESRVLQNTPPPSDEEINDQTAEESVQKKRGRKKVKRDRAKSYRTIHQQKKKIEGLERLVKKYQKRLERIKAKEKASLGSPSPNKKVKTLLGKERVSVPSNIAPVHGITKMKQITYCLQEKKMYGRTLSCRKCPYNKKCEHYNLGVIFSQLNEPEKVKRNFKLKVTDVWSSDEEENVTSTQVVPGTSKDNSENDLRSLVVSVCNIKIGNHLLVRFINDTKANNIRQFVGVCQELDSDDIKVKFLKPVNNKNNLFSVDENDVSFKLWLLPPPTLVVRGNRLFYKFNHAVHVF